MNYGDYSNFLGVCLGGKNCKKRRSARQKSRNDKRDSKNANTFGDAAIKQAQAQLLSSDGQGGYAAQGFNSVAAQNQRSSNNTLLYGGIAAIILIITVIIIIKKRRNKN